tara:strand:+ start:1232 stop:1507 length:276 start_codon:yes stop_codon:yes gene_type:complete
MKFDKKEVKETFVKNFFELRIIAGKRGVDIAKEVGVTQGAVGSWANGKNFPSPEHMKKIAECLDCDVKDLITPRPYSNNPLEVNVNQGQGC